MFVGKVFLFWSALRLFLAVLFLAVLGHEGVGMMGGMKVKGKQ